MPTAKEANSSGSIRCWKATSRGTGSSSTLRRFPSGFSTSHRAGVPAWSPSQPRRWNHSLTGTPSTASTRSPTSTPLPCAGSATQEITTTPAVPEVWSGGM